MPVVCFTKNTTVQNTPYGTPDTVNIHLEDVFLRENIPDYNTYEDQGSMGATASEHYSPLFRAGDLHQIPTNAENIQATLFIFTGGGFGSFVVDVREVLKRWFPFGLTWNSQTTSIPWTTAGAIDPADVGSSEDSVTIDSGSVWESFDISLATASNIADPRNNNGVILSPQADVASFRFFDKSDGGPDGQRPEIHISYDLPVASAGGEPSFSRSIVKPVTSELTQSLILTGQSGGGGGPAPVPTPTQKSVFVFGHSLFNHTLTDANGFTNTGVHIGDMSRQSFNRVVCEQIFGQLRNQTLPPPIGNRDRFASNQFNPWTGGNWYDVGWTDVLVMASNFEQTFKTPTEFATESDAVLSYIDTNTSANIIVYEHWAEPTQYGLSVINGNEMSPADWNSFKELHRDGGAYHTWHVGYQDQIETNGYTCYMIPIGPIVMDALQTESYLSSIEHQDLYVDAAPHGNATMYFLAGLVTYIALFGVPNVNFSPTGFSFVHSSVTSNLSSLTAFISSRLAFYGANGVNLPPSG